MIKTINPKLSKKLNELGLLDNIETEYYVNYITDGFGKNIKMHFNEGFGVNWIKTLTLEEAINFIITKTCPIELNDYFSETYTDIILSPSVVMIMVSSMKNIEKILEYLIENNLLTNDN